MQALRLIFAIKQILDLLSEVNIMENLIETNNSAKKLLQNINRLTTYSQKTVLKSFIQTCSELINDINQNHPVDAETIERFSKFTIFLLRNNTIPQTEVFEKLSGKLTDYWHYKLVSEKDPRRGCSYVQIYQMVNMIHQNAREKKAEHSTHTSKGSQHQNTEIIKAIKQSPGITFMNLIDYTKLNSDVLSKRLAELEKQNFVVSRRNGTYRYYILTYLGNSLYQDLCCDTQKIWLDQWSSERISVLKSLLLYIRKYNYPILVHDVVNMISLFSENDIFQLNQYFQSTNNPYIKDTKFSQTANYLCLYEKLTDKKIVDIG